MGASPGTDENEHPDSPQNLIGDLSAGMGAGHASDETTVAQATGV